ncbi:MAG: universal stress protein [Anaerolineae bacterium]|nr:universal stress protein [Anaerolineae bacterium]
MAHVSRKLSNAFEGALAGGGDPATSPLYVFGPFLRLIVVAGVAQITFGASIWLVIFTIALVSAMYRLVMVWITDGSGGSGLNEEEFGGWAVKVNAGITVVEYTLTFLVSMAALVTFVADRVPTLNQTFIGIELRVYVAIALSVLTGWLVNRGPKVAARAFGPATLGVLILLWAMIISTIFKLGFQLPDFNLEAFSAENIRYTLGGYARILAVMTGIEIFANLVPAYKGTSAEKSRKAFNSLLIIMGTTGLTMLIVGPAIFQLADPTNTEVSVFTQTMDQLLPEPLAWLGTIVGVAVLLSASAASAQGLQNLALGLKYRNYVPAFIGQRNRFGVADKPVWLEVAVVSLCFVVFGADEETYLAIYAAGVFILLSMTGWAATRRLFRNLRSDRRIGGFIALVGTVAAALLTSVATLIIFEERFFEGAWTYLLFLPLLYILFTWFRRHLGEPTLAEEHLGKVILDRKYLRPFHELRVGEHLSTEFERIIVPLDGSDFAERPLSFAQSIAHAYDAQMTLMTVAPPAKAKFRRADATERDQEWRQQVAYLDNLVQGLQRAGINADFVIESGSIVEQIDAFAAESHADLILMSTHGRSGMERWLIGSVANKLTRQTSTPVLLVRPTVAWRSRWSQFKRLLVALDGSQNAEYILPYAVSFALHFDSEIILLSVPSGQEDAISSAHSESIRTYLEHILDVVRAQNIEAQAIVTGSSAASTIIDVCEDEEADLIMMTTHGFSGLDRFMLGSVAERVIQHTIAPVFLLPSR